MILLYFMQIAISNAIPHLFNCMEPRKEYAVETSNASS